MSAAEEFCLDGYSATELAAQLGLPRVEVLEQTRSTLDVAHALAAKGAPSGTLVIADRQTEGRGRGGSTWVSPAGTGLWLTLIERPSDGSGLEVLSLRTGIRAARALDVFADEPIRLKWPNDLYVAGSKLGGILIEARWREQKLEWVAVGIGINVARPTDVPGAAALDPGTRRIDVLTELLPALRSAVPCTGELTRLELLEFDTRDLARGHHCREPAQGIVRGINASGELLVALADSVARFRTGSLILDQTS
ncbi:MAG TPA: biotin--[acetyl-CoA-carboxylase] ligase [Gemmatimonadaceae bacterium]|nr:biotin--[acetyl-CoA-carboxylase] ligase [Gemmatimonadaceae bacterium]